MAADTQTARQGLLKFIAKGWVEPHARAASHAFTDAPPPVLYARRAEQHHVLHARGVARELGLRVLPGHGELAGRTRPRRRAVSSPAAHE